MKREFRLIIDNEDVDHESFAEAGIKDELQQWPLFGLSVGSFLQVIAMDRQTCIMEVYRDANSKGRFCFVEGELYDAVNGDLEGETAAMEMIAWENVRLNIKQVVNAGSVKRRIDKNLMLLLMESTRRRDEILSNSVIPDTENTEDLDDLEDILDDVERERFDACFKLLINEMGGALAAASIININESKIMAHYKFSLETVRAFLRLTGFFKKAFDADSKLKLGDCYILELKNHQLLVSLVIGEHQWCVMFDNSQCSLGTFRNVVMPRVIQVYNEML